MSFPLFMDTPGDFGSLAGAITGVAQKQDLGLRLVLRSLDKPGDPLLIRPLVGEHRRGFARAMLMRGSMRDELGIPRLRRSRRERMKDAGWSSPADGTFWWTYDFPDERSLDFDVDRFFTNGEVCDSGADSPLGYELEIWDCTNLMREAIDASQFFGPEQQATLPYGINPYEYLFGFD